jgi:hypothetical protein
METSNGSAMTVSGGSSITARVQAMKTALEEESAMRGMVREYVSRHMVEGTDYGNIPGTDKDKRTLLKPGAEKLVDLFRCTPVFRLMTNEEDFERQHFNYMFRVRLVQRDGGAVLAEGYGSANSKEGRYRWRNAARKCPSCGAEKIIKGKAEYGGGWLCFKKSGGCGAKFGDGDPKVEGQEVGRVENDDVASLANTILKMAKKRALVDGAIALARCSDMFTQDLEEEMEHGEPPPKPQPRAPQQAAPPPQQAAPAPVTQFEKPPPPPTPKAEPKQPPALRARAAKLYRDTVAMGWTLESFQGFVADILGQMKPSADWTIQELTALEEAFARGKKEGDVPF